MEVLLFPARRQTPIAVLWDEERLGQGRVDVVRLGTRVLELLVQRHRLEPSMDFREFESPWATIPIGSVLDGERDLLLSAALAVSSTANSERLGILLGRHRGPVVLAGFAMSLIRASTSSSGSL